MLIKNLSSWGTWARDILFTSGIIRWDMGPSARAWCIMYLHHSSCRKWGVMSRAHTWLFCMASHNSVETAPPGQSSLCRRKHLRPQGAVSRKETSWPASSVSLSSGLWHTSTSYLLLHRCWELRADGDLGGSNLAFPCEEAAAKGEVDVVLTESAGLFVPDPSSS